MQRFKRAVPLSPIGKKETLRFEGSPRNLKDLLWAIEDSPYYRKVSERPKVEPFTVVRYSRKYTIHSSGSTTFRKSRQGNAPRIEERFCIHIPIKGNKAARRAIKLGWAKRFSCIFKKSPTK